MSCSHPETPRRVRPERVSVVTAPSDWRDAEWSQRRVRPSVRACMGARVSFPNMGNSYESGVYVCLQSPGKVRNPPEVWSSGGGGGGGSNSSSSKRDYEAGASPSRVPGFSVMLRKPRNPRRKFANFQPVRRRRRVTWGRPGERAGGSLSPGRRAAAATSGDPLPAAAGGRAPGEGRLPLEGT